MKDDEKKKALARAKATKIQDYIDVFDNERGKAVLLDLMSNGFILKPTSGDPLNEGKREMVLYILDMITYDVEDIMNVITTKDNTQTSSGGSDEDEVLFNFFKD